MKKTVKKFGEKGFTLIEMLISIAIISIITTISVYNYGVLNDNLALSGAGQEIAISARKSQTNAVSVKSNSTGFFTNGYGMYFDQNDTNNYILFVDSNNNGYYDTNPDCGSSNSECLERISLKNNVKIDTLCVVDFADVTSCSSGQAVQIFFKRPSLEGFIHFGNGSNLFNPPDYKRAEVGLKSPRGALKSIKIEFTGQTSIQ